MNRISLILFPSLLLAGCTVGPDYARPQMQTPASFKAEEGWVAAAPSDHIDRGRWWQLFHDNDLNLLAERALSANQTIAQAEANYRAARYATRESRASLFPSVDLSGSAQRAATDLSGNGDGAKSTYQVAIGGSWEPDLFGRIRQTINNAQATAEARRADLASAQLSIMGELATTYFNLRATDAEIALVEKTVAGYERALQIATNRYNAGIVARTDVFQAQSQLSSTRSQLEGLRRDRQTYENAIAVLAGEPASNFSLPVVAQWVPVVPSVPLGVPSTIIQRRPDVASAERTVAAANAMIGIEKSAFFPTITLSADAGTQASSVGKLFSSATSLWGLGASLAETIFDAGARTARVKQARASYDAAVAGYKETVLEAFEDIENQLTASQILVRQEQHLREASVAADKSEMTTLNQYKEGQITYTDVVTAQATALAARRSLVQASVDRQTAAVALIQALGGAWDGESYLLLGPGAAPAKE